MTYEYMIGDTLNNMDLLEDLTVPVHAPKYEYMKSASVIQLLDKSERGIGLPATRWSFGFLTTDQRAALRELCAGRSADVFIRTPDDTEDFKTYSCKMIWLPESENRQASRVIDFSLEFRHMIYIPDPT